MKYLFCLFFYLWGISLNSQIIEYVVSNIDTTRSSLFIRGYHGASSHKSTKVTNVLSDTTNTIKVEMRYSGCRITNDIIRINELLELTPPSKPFNIIILTFHDSAQGCYTGANPVDSVFISYNDLMSSDTFCTEDWSCEEISNIIDLVNSINIYPNPCKEFIHINNTLNTIKNIIVYDIYGRKVKEFFDHFDKISLSSLNNGIYFFTLKNHNGTTIKKERIVVQK